jgi:hypothetical protein
LETPLIYSSLLLQILLTLLPLALPFIIAPAKIVLTLTPRLRFPVPPIRALFVVQTVIIPRIPAETIAWVIAALLIGTLSLQLLTLRILLLLLCSSLPFQGPSLIIVATLPVRVLRIVYGTLRFILAPLLLEQPLLFLTLSLLIGSSSLLLGLSFLIETAAVFLLSTLHILIAAFLFSTSLVGNSSLFFGLSFLIVAAAVFLLSTLHILIAAFLFSTSLVGNSSLFFGLSFLIVAAAILLLLILELGPSLLLTSSFRFSALLILPLAIRLTLLVLRLAFAAATLLISLPALLIIVIAWLLLGCCLLLIVRLTLVMATAPIVLGGDEANGSQTERYNQCETANLKILHG